MASRESIENALDRVRPYLREDGGDVELVRVTDDGIVEVRLLGSCQACAMSLMTLRAGIERALLIEFPDVRRIERVR